MRNIHTLFFENYCLLYKYYIYLQMNSHKKCLCSRSDIDVQKVESGKFKLITLNKDMSGRVHTCIGCGFLFHVFFVIGFYQSLTLRKCGLGSTPHFLFGHR